MRRVLRVLGIPVLSFETSYDESDCVVVVSNGGGQFELAADAPPGRQEYEYAPDDPEGGFGFRSR